MAETGAYPSLGPSQMHQGGEYGSLASGLASEKHHSLLLSGEI